MARNSIRDACLHEIKIDVWRGQLVKFHSSADSGMTFSGGWGRLLRIRRAGRQVSDDRRRVHRCGSAGSAGFQLSRRGDGRRPRALHRRVEHQRQLYDCIGQPLQIGTPEKHAVSIHIDTH